MTHYITIYANTGLYVHVVGVNVDVVSRGGCVLHCHVGGARLHHNVVTTAQQCAVCNVHLHVEGVGLGVGLVIKVGGGAYPQTDWFTVVLWHKSVRTLVDMVVLPSSSHVQDCCHGNHHSYQHH